MKKCIGLGLALVLLCGVSGCGSSEAEEAAKDLIATMNELTAILNGIKDDASADAAIPKIEKQAEKMSVLNRKMKLNKLTAEEDKKLEEKYRAQVAEAGKKLAGAMASAIQKAPRKAQQILAAVSRVRPQA